MITTTIFLIILLVPNCVENALGYISREYNAINYQHFDTLAEFKQRYLTLDGNVAFGENVLLGVATKDCMGMLAAPAFRGAQRHAASSITVASLPQEEFPVDLDECAEVFMYKYNSTVLTPSERTTVLDHTELSHWIQQMIRVNVDFWNKFDHRIVIYWHSENEREGDGGHRTLVLAPGEHMRIGSFLGHVFSAHLFTEETEGEGDLVDWMVVSESGYTWSSLNRIETCEIVPGAQTQHVAAEEHTCDNLKSRFAEFEYQVFFVKRLGLNYVQPQLVRAVTTDGFLHTRLPENTFKWLRKWYDLNKIDNNMVEHSVGPCMNQHVAVSVMTHLPQNLKEKLSKDVAPLLKDWYGGELDLTAIYGVRKYVDRSVLRMHVDTVNTHVVSAIINVDQGVNEDWPLLILDHYDNEHSVIMKPGDMLLYESAKLLHGRPTVFNGEHYDNIFIHYKPKRGWNYDWL